MTITEDKLDKIIKLLEDIKAGQPIPNYPPIQYYPVYPQPYTPIYPDPYQPTWTCTPHTSDEVGTVNPGTTVFDDSGKEV